MALGSNQVTRAVANNFIPELWSDEVIGAYKSNLVVANLVTRLATTRFDLYAPITSSLHSSGMKLLAIVVVTWFEPKAILLLH